MGFRQDFVNAVRRRVWPRIHHLLAGTVDGYAVTHTTEEEYVMTVHCSEADLERVLDEELGFSRNPISALKVRLDGNTAEGSWVWRDSLLADWQLHVVLHAVDGGAVDVYAHWEYSWVTHPLEHYAGRGYDAEKGVRLARSWLADHDGEQFPEGLPYRVESAAYRRGRELLYAVYHELEGTEVARYLDPFVADRRARGVDGRPNVSPRIVD
ncbi:hypothetical protein [Halomarina rubra]|uniref:Uncharacterized protein n=1 Tax=Halomarina rubra TaxID=2071873 RepID=A0ABD6AQM9_9EURY|nr:hypothetical protein [Halomarina rubra]